MNPHPLLPLLILYVLLPSLGSAGEELASLEHFARSEKHMGMEFTVRLYAPSEDAAERAFRESFSLIAEYDRLMSDYDPESELSRLFQQAPTHEPVPVSDPLWEVLTKAREFSGQTDGAFDVTVGPLTRLWRRARRQREMPEEEELRAAMAAVGWQNVTLYPERQAVGFKRPKMRIDLGGIAPGYAADRVLARLRSLGIKSALVDASGDVVVSEPPPGKPGWRVGIAPLEGDGPPMQIVLLKNAAISTSGDAFRGVEIEGVRYSHIVDPKTGVGVRHRSSVTVIAPDITTADVLATALSVVGPEEGLNLLKRFPQAEARIVAETEAGKLVEKESPGFKEYLAAP